MATEKKIFCGNCGTQNPVENNFCFKCGNKIIEPVIQLEVTKPVVEVKKTSVRKPIPQNIYTELNKKLIKLIKISGFFNLKVDKYNIEYLKISNSFKVYIGLGLIKNYSNEERDKLIDNGFEIIDSKFSKSIVLTNTEIAIEQLISETKALLENLLKTDTINEFEFIETFSDSNAKIVNEDVNPKMSGKTIFFLVVIFLALIGYCTQSDKSTNNNTANQVTENNNEETIDLNKFSGQQFTFKSNSYDIEKNGKTVQTKNDVTYHIFDFVNKTVTQKSQLNGDWVKTTYPMTNFYSEKGSLATTYIIQVGTLGVSEIWFSPDVPNLGYDYNDGTRIACYEITKE